MICERFLISIAKSGFNIFKKISPIPVSAGVDFYRY